MRQTVSALAVLATLAAAAAPAVAAPVPAPRLVAAASALGSLAPYRTIVSDTLTIVDKGDIAGARARIKDLETLWDKDEATLKPKDKTAWTGIDKSIDNALTAIRSPSPKPADCATALKALMAKMDTVSPA